MSKLHKSTDCLYLNIKMDRETMSRVGLNVSDALNVVSIATGGGNAGQIFEGDRRFDLIVKLPEEVRQNIAALQTLPIPLPLNSKSTCLIFSCIKLLP